jgi:dTDP-4-dehydrorhamnose 3,5-epimerase
MHALGDSVKILSTPFKDAYVLMTDPFEDERGRFTRVFCRRELEQIGHCKEIVQINHSLTKNRGALRGMHFQRPPKSEIKIVYCLRGSVFDVMIDLRRNSPSFLHWHAEILSPDNRRIMYIPEGFAHGFQALEDHVELIYLHTEFYSPEHEAGLRYDEPRVGVRWPMPIRDISGRDRSYTLLDSDFEGISG